MLKLLKVRNIVYILVVLVGVGIFDPYALSFAAGDDVLQDIAAVLSVIIKLVTFFALLIMSWGGELLGTSFLTSEEALAGIRPIWIFIRNITNIGFVLVLLYLAFANLFSFGEGNWTIKDKLPKIIFSLVAINFSLLAFRVVLDAVNVGTVAILSIADEAIKEKGGGLDVEDLLNRSTDKKGKTCTSGPDCKSFMEQMNELMCSNGSEENCFFKLVIPKEKALPTTSNLLLSFGVYFQHIEQLPALAADLKDVTGVIDSVLFSTVMALAYIVALIAVFIALLVRIVALWFFMVFSPFLVAAGIMGFGGGSSELMTKLVTYIIMPLKIAAAFSISFIMIAVLIDFEPSSSMNFIKVGPSLAQFAGNNMFGILWKILTVVIFWTVAFKALEGTDIEGITNQIKDGAAGAGKFLTKAATVDRQILKMPGSSEKVSLTSLGKLPAAIETFVEAKNVAGYQQMQSALKLTSLSKEMAKVVQELKSKKAGDFSTQGNVATYLKDTVGLGESRKSEMVAPIVEMLETSGRFDTGFDKLKTRLTNASGDPAVEAAYIEFFKNNKYAEGQKEDFYKNWGGDRKEKDDKESKGKFDVLITNDNGKDIAVINQGGGHEVIINLYDAQKEGDLKKRMKILQDEINTKVNGDSDTRDSLIAEQKDVLEKAGFDKTKYEIKVDGTGSGVEVVAIPQSSTPATETP